MAIVAQAWRIVLVAAFLLAQNAALAHPIFHLGAANAAQTGLASSDADDGKSQRDGRLCDFHTAMGAVLGALSGGVLSAGLVERSPIQVAAIVYAAVSLPALPPASRGPPSFP